MKAPFRPRMALFGLVLSLVTAAVIVSCRDTRTTDEKVYDAFVLLHTDPDGWNDRIGSMSKHTTPEIFERLGQIRVQIDEARRSYLRSCNVLTNPNSSACRTLAELNDVMQTLDIAEQGLKSGRSLEGTLEGAFFGGLAKQKGAERADVATRVRPYFMDRSDDDPADS